MYSVLFGLPLYFFCKVSIFGLSNLLFLAPMLEFVELRVQSIPGARVIQTDEGKRQLTLFPFELIESDHTAFNRTVMLAALMTDSNGSR